MENVNTKPEEIFNRTYEVAANAGGVKTLLPINGLEPEGFCINSRDLHKAMGVKSQYADWIKSRINRYKFKENSDYISTKGSEIKNARGGDRKSVDYLFTIVTANILLALESLRGKRSSSDNIYLIQNTSTKSVKIGTSRDVEGRLKSLQTGHEHQLKLIYTKPVEDASGLELKLHHKFSDKRVRGEWFKVNPELVIKEVEELTTKGLAEPLARLQRLALDQLRHKL